MGLGLLTKFKVFLMAMSTSYKGALSCIFQPNLLTSIAGLRGNDYLTKRGGDGGSLFDDDLLGRGRVRAHPSFIPASLTRPLFCLRSLPVKGGLSTASTYLITIFSST